MATPTTDPTPYDHSDDWREAPGIVGTLHTLFDVLQALEKVLRPISGHMNVRPAPADRVSFATYTQPAGVTTPLPFLSNLPRGTACRATVRLHTEGANAIYVTTTPNSTDTSAAYLVPDGAEVTFDVRSDLYAFDATAGGFTLSVAIYTWDAPA